MKGQHALSDKVKLPSNWMLVNPESIWKFLACISKTGNVFNKEQLIKSGLYTSNEDNISRNLSYLKYLGIVEEERGKDKDQRFNVVNKTIVKNIFYELKAGRDNDAKQKLKEHLQSHALYSTLKDEFFKEDQIKTLNDLEHFLKDGMPGKTPQYYQKGGEFLIKLLSLASLAQLIGNEIKLDIQKVDSQNENETEETPVVEIVNSSERKMLPLTSKPVFDDAQIVISNKYLIKFTGPGMNAEYEIQEEDDLLIVEATLSKIKKKLAASENS